MKKLGAKGLVLGLALAVVLVGAGVYAVNLKKDEAPAVAANSEEPAAAAEEAKKSEDAGDDLTFENASLPKDPLGARTLGDPKAPVKIAEYASLTCGHCAHFEKATFPELKKKYIDTGKVFFTYVDFPINAPALDAAMIARCLPPERYFPFVVMLFASQEDWAFTQDYKTNLRQSAKLAGLSDEKFDTCLENKSLKEGIIKNMQEGQGKGVDSTPTFIVNGTIIKGAMDIAVFDKAIADAQEKAAGKKE